MRTNKLLGIRLKVALLISILSLVIVTLSASTGVAFADGPDKTNAEVAPEEITMEALRSIFDRLSASSDAHATFALLSPAQQTAVTNAMESAVTESYTTMSTAEASSDSEVCNFYSDWVQHVVPLINVVLWEYVSSTKWCYDGTELTRDPVWTRSVDVSGLWEFVGHIDETGSGGEGDWEYYNYTEGHFRVCIGPGNTGCIKNRYPDIAKWLRADGSYESATND